MANYGGNHDKQILEEVNLLLDFLRNEGSVGGIIKGSFAQQGRRFVRLHGSLIRRWKTYLEYLRDTGFVERKLHSNQWKIKPSGQFTENDLHRARRYGKNYKHESGLMEREDNALGDGTGTADDLVELQFLTLQELSDHFGLDVDSDAGRLFIQDEKLHKAAEDFVTEMLRYLDLARELNVGGRWSDGPEEDERFDYDTLEEKQLEILDVFQRLWIGSKTIAEGIEVPRNVAEKILAARSGVPS
jgi:hypothetical protein